MKPSASVCRRYLALFLPLLSTDRLHRIAKGRGQAPDKRPLVIVARHANALRLVATDASAREKGLIPGLAFADARARVPDLRVVRHDETADAELLDALADWCDRYSPLVALDPPHGIVLDITGVTHLFGGEEPLAKDIAVRLTAQGLRVRMAIADTARGARALSRFGTGGIVPPGEQAPRMAGLPVDALEAEASVGLALRRAGLGTIGDLSSRPRKPLAARFGSDMTDTLALVLGEIDRPITARRPPPLFIAEKRFADPIGLMDDIDIALDGLAGDLCRSLDRYGQGGRRFEIAFFRADGKVLRLEVLSGQPLKTPPVLKRLIAMRLEALADPLDPGFGFDMIRLAALEEEDASPVQNGLDGRIDGDGELAALIDRLSARFGPQSISRLVPHDTHLPERAMSLAPAIASRPAAWTTGGEQTPMRPLLLFKPAQKIEVVAEIPEGPPRRFRWHKALFEIARTEGPERIAPEWWRATPDTAIRDYFRVEDDKGRRFWLFRHGRYGEAQEVAWYIQGLFA